MWCLDVAIIGLPQSFLGILRENLKSVNFKTVQLILTRPSIRPMKCLHKLSFGVYDSDSGKIPLISELSELYGFEFLPQLKIVTVGCVDNFDDEEEQYQQEFEDADSVRLYYKKYRYCPQPKEQNNLENGNQALDSLESQQMEEQHVELLFLKEKIEEKLKQLKFNSENFKELKSVLHDVTHLLNNI